tara:strand:- start:47 stop:274 length:228 start_codon:yes stop_codon:yes gene_type:complete
MSKKESKKKESDKDEQHNFNNSFAKVMLDLQEKQDNIRSKLTSMYGRTSSKTKKTKKAKNKLNLYPLGSKNPMDK